MKKISLLLVLALMLGSLFSSYAVAQESGGLGIVDTPYGQVSGVYENGVTYYKGVPYAKPPVGDLRWAAPEDPDAWEGVLECDEYAPMAMQILSTADWYGPEFYYDWLDEYPPMSEDCLYLNVVTPATDSADGYPVLIWFHGGAFMHGYSWEPEFEPSELVKKGVIVVSVAYRLGVFGYMATEGLSAASPSGTSGNYALLDQIKSMEWVQKNIAAFGGDPTRVTIGGQSAGAMSVGNIVTSPLAKGLFSGAIVNSSFGMLLSSSYTTLETVEANSQAYLEGKGYGNLSVEELRALPTSAFMNETTQKSEVYGKGFSACVDGYVLTEPSYDFYFREDALEGINIMIGSVSGELNAEFAISTKDAFYESAKRTYGDLYDKYDFESLYPVTGDVGATIESLRLFGQRGAYQSLIFTQVLSKLNPDSSFYPYYFSHWTPGREEEVRWAWHSSELWYAFKSLRDIPEQRDWEKLDYKVAEDYSSYWANFISTGNPNGGELPYWAAAGIDSPVFMDMGDEFVLRSNFYDGTKKTDRDALMRESVINGANLAQYFE